MNQLRVDGSPKAPHPQSMAAKPLLDAERLSGKVVVGGVLCSSITSETFAVENPANQSDIGFVPRCREADVERAVNAAHEAFDSWRKVSARQRGDMLRQIADAIEQEGENLARLLSLETGNALVTQARPEITAMVEMLRLFAGLASELKGKTLPWEFGHLCYTTREPLGVVAAIIPWNAPLFLTAVKLGPALCAGNTAVMKTAEQAPLAVMRSIEIMQQFLPPGVANVISGFGAEAGKPLAEHPLVKKITFTGSGAVGRAILHYAADKLCPVTLELGGKSPNIILPDADLDLAVPGIVTGMRFTRQGQSCSAGSRLLVHDAIYDEVVERAIDAMAKLRIGDPLDEHTQVGTIVSGEQFERVSSYVKLARETQGAKILCGGARPEGVGLEKGYFYQPTLIEGIPHESPVCQDEIFGPVAMLSRWSDYEEMIRMANGTEFGLAAAVWTRDIARAMDFVSRIDAGFVQVNQFITPRASLAYGGFKMSGLGKENTLESMLDHFTASKTVIINPGTPSA
jgi:acyl-CoA reductase-like NAD-dependent aldehyde dehydrogenase